MVTFGDTVEQDARKPDPSEPWRYVCPGCGGQVVGKLGTRSTFRCGRCSNHWREEELRDQKTGALVSEQYEKP